MIFENDKIMIFGTTPAALELKKRKYNLCLTHSNFASFLLEVSKQFAVDTMLQVFVTI